MHKRDPFSTRRAVKASAESQRPLQDQEVGLCSGPYLLVLLILGLCAFWKLLPAGSNYGRNTNYVLYLLEIKIAWVFMHILENIYF